MNRISIIIKHLVAIIIIATTHPIKAQSNWIYSEDRTLSEAIVVAADSMATHKHRYFRFYRTSDPAYLSFENGVVTLMYDENHFFDEAYTYDVFNVIDSLGKTDIYSNKLIAQTVARVLIPYESWKHLNDWQKELFADIARLLNNHTARFFNVAWLLNLLYTPDRELLTPEIVEYVKNEFRNPYRSEEEAVIIAKSYRKWYNLTDTIGYFDFITNKYFWEETWEASKYRNIREQIRTADKQNQTLEQYYDSLNTLSYNNQLIKAKGSKTPGYNGLIEIAGIFRLYQLAPIVDSVCQTPLVDDWPVNARYSCAHLLARLNYKDYPESQTKKFSDQLSKLINELDTKEFASNPALLRHISDIGRAYSNLTFISTDNIVKIAPVLLTDKVHFYQTSDGPPDDYPEFVAYNFYYRLDRKIKGMPQNDDPSINIKGGYKFPYEFYKKVYEWMIENDGKYEYKD